MSQMKELNLPIHNLWNEQYHEEEIEINRIDLKKKKFQIEQTPMITKVISFVSDLLLTEDMKNYIKLNFLQQAFDETEDLAGNDFYNKLSLIHCHSTHELVALTNKQITLIYNVKDILSSSSSSTPIVLKNHRLNGKVLSLAWTNEQQNTLLIGTSNGLCYVLLPSSIQGNAPAVSDHLSSNHFDTGNVNINFISNILGESSSAMSVDFIATSPQGRYYCFISHLKKGKLFLGDSLFGNNGSNVVEYSTALGKKDIVNNLLYSPDGLHVLVSFKSGTILLLDTHRWSYQTFSVGDYPSLDLSGNSLPSTDFLWHSSQLIFCVHQLKNEIFELKLQTKSADSINAARSKNTSNNDQLTEEVLSLSSIQYQLDHAQTKPIKDLLQVKETKISADGKYLAISYLYQDTSIREDEDKMVYPGIDLYLCHQGQYTTFTFLTTIYRENINAKGMIRSELNELAHPMTFSFCNLRDQSWLGRGPTKYLPILTVFWSDLSLTLHQL